jgi:hypothetical protein
MNRLLALLTMVVGAFVWACGDSQGSGDDSDNPQGDTSSASDERGVTDAGDTSAPLGGEACIASISGQVLRNGTSGMSALIAVCRGADLCFTPFDTQADGSFVWDYPGSEETGCTIIDFSSEWLHIDIIPHENYHGFASLAFAVQPTQAEISDQGQTDYDLDVGPLSVFELPEESATYSPETGARVDLFGLSFEIPAGGLVKRPLGADEDLPVENAQEIHVFKAPLDEWDPPFLTAKPDALYYISPRWAKLASPGITLSFEPPEGWNGGDTGVLRLLGRWSVGFEVDEGPMTSEYMYRAADGLCINTDDKENHERMADGFMADCGSVEMTGGRVVTDPIPRLTWVAVAKQ